MELKTYRAKSLQDALRLVRRELGPNAAVLHTREVRAGWLKLSREIEVTASTSVHVPSRMPLRGASEHAPTLFDELVVPEPERRDYWQGSPDGGIDDDCPIDARIGQPPIAPAHEHDYRAKFRQDMNANLRGELDDLRSMVEELCRQHRTSGGRELPESLFHLFTDLLDADVSEELARELVDRVRAGCGAHDLDDPVLLKARIARMIEDEINIAGPIQIAPGKCRVVALVGPTGVGKTTTIAKLAANFRLRHKHRVGLITVDTYRIAAVEQLRTYADIIDLPMEIVATPKEMRSAVERLAGLDLVLLDTAGRSPRDEVKIQELKSMLEEAEPHEVHLVLSAVLGASGMIQTAERFHQVGVTSLTLTKLDETTGLGNLLPLLRSSKLPLSYVTNGQNVPDDIQAAEKRRLARLVLGMEGER